MGTRLVVPPATLPVTLAEAKAHLCVDFVDHDEIISGMISAATDYAQRFSGRAFVEQTWELMIDAFPTSEIKIPYPPLISVVSLKYYSSVGNETTLDASTYTVDNVSEPGWVVPSSSGWPTALDAINAVIIQFRAGYETDIPASIKSAILLTIGTLYANRETVIVGQIGSLLPWSAEQMLRQYRVHTAIA